MISVVIPAFKEKKNLSKLFPRLCQLASKHDVEVLVSLGTCSDDYSECSNHDIDIRLIKNNRKGRARQMNDGAALANGDVLVFLHADVMPPDGFFTDIKKTLATGNDAGFFSYRFDKNSFLLRINASFTKRDGLFTGGGDQCLFIKKSVFESMGGFNEEQVLMEDFEFFKRMKSKGVPYKIVDNDLVVSARKYQDNSYLRVNLSNLLLVTLFKLGCAPKRLKVLHNRLLRLSYQNNS